MEKWFYGMVKKYFYIHYKNKIGMSIVTKHQDIIMFLIVLMKQLVMPNLEVFFYKYKYKYKKVMDMRSNIQNSDILRKKVMIFILNVFFSLC